MTWSTASITRLMDVYQDHFREIKHLEPLIHEVPIDLPKEYDPREHWSNCPSLKEIRDQGRICFRGLNSYDIFILFYSCGSCWALGAVEMMTDRICIASNGTQNVQISAEDLLGMLT
jgi:cathepsin B